MVNYAVIYEREDRKSIKKETHLSNSLIVARRDAKDMLNKDPERKVLITKMSIFKGKPWGWEAYEQVTVTENGYCFTRIYH
jgi:hypothetical protein